MKYPRISKEDLAVAVAGIANKEAYKMDEERQTGNVARWRDENPFACTRWCTAHGVVTGIFGWKFYRGECSTCGTLITANKPYPKTLNWNTGKWPQVCDGCRAARLLDAPLRARARMRKLRQRQYAQRDAMLESVGITPPRQGVAPKGKSNWPR